MGGVDVHNPAGGSGVGGPGAWAPAGGGGSPDVIVTLPSLAPGEYSIVTHNAVALADSNKLDVSAFTDQVGQSISYTQPADGHPIGVEDFDLTNENTSNRLWIRTDVNKGRFSGSKDYGVLAGCAILINDETAVERKIVSILGNGTFPNSVVLDGDTPLGPPMGTAISYIRGPYFGGFGLILSPGLLTPCPIGYWYIARSKISMRMPCAMWANINMMMPLGPNIPALTEVKMAFSKDGGTTWYYHNGTDWVTMLLTEFATKGCIVVNGYDVLYSSDNTQITNPEWNALNIPAAANLDSVIAMKSTDPAATITMPNWYWGGTQPTGYQFGGYLDLYRLSTTQLIVWNRSQSATYTDVKVVVRP